MAIFNLYWLISFKVLESVCQNWAFFSRIGDFIKNWVFWQELGIFKQEFDFFGNNWIIFGFFWQQLGTF